MKQPRLRFKADDGSDFPDWESKSFSDVFTGLSNNTLSRDCLNSECGQAKNIHYGDVLIKYGSVVDIQTDGVPFVNSDIDCKRWDCLKDGDIVIADTAEDETVGKVVEIMNVGSDTLFSGLHTIACRPRIAFASKYLGYYMNSKAYHDQLRPYMQGIKVTSVSKSNISLTHIEIPSLPEQRKIADLFSTVDSVIDAQQAEVDAWKQRKKGAMQKLFSQEDRFKADDGSDFPDWEKKKLGEICEYGRQRGIGAHYIGTENMLKDFEGIAINDPEAEASGLLYFEGDTLMSNIRPYLKKAWKANCNGACSTDVLVFHPTNVDSEYLHCMIASDLFVTYIMSAAKGSKMPRGDKTHIMQMPLILPSLPEQRKIADCLSSIDDVIVKAKDELTKWQELRKGLLQQMFV